MHDKKTKIKRCPFCGNKAHVVIYADDNSVDAYTVVCNDNACRGGLFYTDLRLGSFTEELAIEIWNERKSKKWTSKKK